MPGLEPKGTRYRLGPFELNTAEESLARNGARVKVQDLPYRLLAMLVEAPGRLSAATKSGNGCGQTTRLLISITAWAWPSGKCATR